MPMYKDDLGVLPVLVERVAYAIEQELYGRSFDDDTMRELITEGAVKAIENLPGWPTRITGTAAGLTAEAQAQSEARLMQMITDPNRKRPTREEDIARARTDPSYYGIEPPAIHWTWQYAMLAAREFLAFLEANQQRAQFLLANPPTTSQAALADAALTETNQTHTALRELERVARYLRHLHDNAARAHAKVGKAK
jgi:hypothetical protein